MGHLLLEFADFEAQAQREIFCFLLRLEVAGRRLSDLSSGWQAKLQDLDPQNNPGVWYVFFFGI